MGDAQRMQVGSLPSQQKPWANRPKACSDGQVASARKGEQISHATEEVSPTTGLDVEREKQIVAEAVKSLYKDQITPHSPQVLRRIEEISGQRWQTQQLQKLCKSMPEITLVDNLQCFTVMLEDYPAGFEGFVDCWEQEDPFP